MASLISLFCPACDGSYPETEWRQTIAALPVVSGATVTMSVERRHSRCRRRAAFVVEAAVVA